MPELIPAEPGSPEWLAARRQGVTATDIVTILGLSSHDSAYSLFWRKMGQVPEPADSDRFRLGRELEGYIRERWEESGEHYAKPGGGKGLYRHGGRAWQMATPDAVTLDGEPLELKSWADADRSAWQDGPPGAVRAQVLWQMGVMEVAAGHVGVVFLPSGEFRSYVISHEHTREPIGCAECDDLELMLAAGEEFMARLRLELPQPDPDASMATLAAQRARFARQPDKQAEVSKGLWNAWYGAKAELVHWEQVVRKYEIQLREQAGEASVYTVDGQPVARRVVSTVAAHYRKASVRDYLRRIKLSGDDDE
jgi:putative phage-type endonuclease